MGGLGCQASCGTCACNKDERDELEVVYSQQRDSTVNLESLAAGQRVGSHKKFETMRAGSHRDGTTTKVRNVSRSLTLKIEKELKRSLSMFKMPQTTKGQHDDKMFLLDDENLKALELGD